MSKIIWDRSGERRYETGTKHGVLYKRVASAENPYPFGVAWNGLTAVTVSPEGAEATDLYADDIKYLTMRSAENVKATIEAYTYPDEWAECDGSVSYGSGALKISQQPRIPFGFVWETVLGNDAEMDNYGKIIHILYGCSASPSEKAYQTINDSPEAITFSWEIDTIPVEIPGTSLKPTAYMEIDSTKCTVEQLAAIEAALFGQDADAGNGIAASNPYLPLPAWFINTLGGSASVYTFTAAEPVGSEDPSAEGWYVRSGNDYILSTDTSVVTGTSYYIRSVVT